MQVLANLPKFLIRNHIIQSRGLKDIIKSVSNDLIPPIEGPKQPKYQQETNEPKLQNKTLFKVPIINRISISIKPDFRELLKKHRSSQNLLRSHKNLTSDTVRLRKVLPRDARNVIKLFQQSFTKCDPLANCLEMPEKPLFCPILQEFWINSIRQGMTYAAIPSTSVSVEELYGAVLNTRLTQLEPDHWWLYSQCSNCPQTKNLLNLWSYLVKDSAIHEKCAIKKILNIAHIIINENESKKLNPKFDQINISKVLMSKSFRIASTKGYKMVSFICSTDSMSEAAQQLNMEQIYENSYKNIVESILKTGFSKLIPDLSIKIFTKKID